MEKLRDESIQRGIDETRVDVIKTIMKKLKFTAIQAMDFLEIPPADQPKYLKKL